MKSEDPAGWIEPIDHAWLCTKRTDESNWLIRSSPEPTGTVNPLGVVFFSVAARCKSRCLLPISSPIVLRTSRRETKLADLLVQHATESLERSQRVRLDRILLDWEETILLAPPPPKRPRSLTARFRDWLLCPQPQRESFDSYLTDAHRHEAVVRSSGRGTRHWFDDWRRHALAALRLGLSPSELVELLRSVPVAVPERAAPTKPVRRSTADFAALRERLENVIFPNAPATAGAFRDLISGDGPAAARI